MLNFTPDKLFLRRVLLHYFNSKIRLLYCFFNLKRMYGVNSLSASSCLKWFERFNSNNFELEYEDVSEEFDVLIGEDPEIPSEISRKMTINFDTAFASRFREPVSLPTLKRMFIRTILLHYSCDLQSNDSGNFIRRFLKSKYKTLIPSQQTCLKWINQFKKGDFNIEDKKRVGRPKKFKDEELNLLLNTDSRQSKQKIARTLGVSRRSISRRLQTLKLNRKAGNCVSKKF